MHSIEIIDPIQTHIKKKICILGGQENYKDEFQKRISSNCLPIENKHNIGVNISKIDYFFTPNQKFEFLLWNIDCRQNRAFLRTIFYSGADILIIFISETKIDQIQQYYKEIQSRIPDTSLIFCIILENRSKQEIMDISYQNDEIVSILSDNDIQIYEISDPTEIFEQISTLFLEKLQNKELDKKYIIDFVQLNSLFGHSVIRDECNDYFEPDNPISKSKLIVNTELLNAYIKKLDLDINHESHNWIKIRNKTLGTFSIYIKNGNTYYFPKVCEKCKDKKCLKFKKAPYFICIEAGDSNGWSNIEGFNQIELLILTKIIALKEGDEKSLPKSVINQIYNINVCEKKKKL
ncbi:MAG: hypothetical protein ACXAEX_02425 [Promethearchaeota archaeon]